MCDLSVQCKNTIKFSGLKSHEMENMKKKNN